MKQETLKNQIRKAYETNGQSAAYDVANKHADMINYEYCKGCETSAPAIDHECTICGEPTQDTSTRKNELDIPKGNWYFYDSVNNKWGGYGAGEWVQMELATRLSKKELDTMSIGRLSFTELGGRDKADHKKATDTMQAICTAVNETYGKGYNPAAMEELYTLLNDVAIWGKSKDGKFTFTNSDPDYLKRLQTALTNAKL